MMVVLGLDPGLRVTGWGVVDFEKTGLTYQASGLIKTSDKASVSVRLAVLFKELTEIIEKYQPEEVAVEEVFVNKNPETSLKLALARGVVLCAPAVKEIPVYPYTANHVKKAVVGHGHAEKHQVAWAVQQILKLPSLPQKDASDALALAICHSHARPAYKNRL